MKKMSESYMERDSLYGMSHSSALTRENEYGCLLGNSTWAANTHACEQISEQVCTD